MDKKYLELFQALCTAAETTAESAMEYNRSQNETKGEEASQRLRDDFARLGDKLNAENFDGNLARSEYAQLAVAAYIVMNNLKTKIDSLRKSITAYETDIMPKLSQIIDESSSDEEAQSIADKILIIESNE